MANMSRIVGAGLLTALLCSPAVAAGATAAPADHAVFIVSALPGEPVGVSVDGAEALELDAGTVSDGMNLAQGEHVLTFTGDGWTMDVDVDLDSVGSTDVVIHRPASPAGDPVVTTFAIPQAPITNDRGRVQVAHTATVPPADILVDGDVVFANVANGEYASADLPAGVHDVSIVPTGVSEPTLLGPLPVEVEPATLTRVYAVGQPETGSMDVVVASLPLPTRGSPAPEEVDTGSAGLVSGWSSPGDSGSGLWATALVPTAAGIVMAIWLLRRVGPAPRHRG